MINKDSQRTSVELFGSSRPDSAELKRPGQAGQGEFISFLQAWLWDSQHVISPGPQQQVAQQQRQE